MIEKTMKMHPRGDQIMEKYIRKVENKILNQVSSAWKVFINDIIVLVHRNRQLLWAKDSQKGDD